MYTKILIPIDGSEHARRALDHAIKLAGNLDSNPLLTIMHVKDILPYLEPISGTNVLEMQEDSAQELIQPAVSLVEEAGLGSFWLSVQGDPAQTICKAAAESGYDLIIMGSRGLGRFTEMFLGSVSHKVIQYAPCPVLVVK
jgi:nucleotide-binding universal stress UspA family protein